MPMQTGLIDLKRHLHRLPAVLILMGYGMALAQSGSALEQVAAARLPDVVVSGSRQEQTAADLPQSIDVINADELEAWQSHDIRDAVRNLPNVSVRRAPARFSVTGVGNPTGRDGNAGFNIRGQDGNRVLMLVDGIRLPHSYVNGSNAFGRDSLALGLVKRIELVRGPTSALYGSDGLAGLVNFITHEPADLLGRDAAGMPRLLGGQASAAYHGDDRSRALAATLAGRASDTLDWLISTSVSRAHGLSNRGDNAAPNLDRTTPNPQYDRNAALLGKLVLQPNASQKQVFTLEHVGRDSDFELLSSRARLPLTGTPAQIAAAVVGESATQSMTRDRLSWNGRFDLAQSWADRLQTVLSWQNASAQDVGATQRNSLLQRLRDTSYHERSLQASVQAEKALSLDQGWRQKITYGLDWQRTLVTNWFDGLDPGNASFVARKYFPDTRDSSRALFAQTELIGGDWRITPGLRYDHFSLDVISQAGFSPPSVTPGKSLSGAAVSPKFGVLYRVTPQWSLLGQAASGFRAPNAQQINGAFENTAVQVKLLPNPELKPEKSRSLEFGLRGRLDALSLDLTVFSSHFEHLIYDKKPLGGSGVAGDPLLFQTVNIDRARLRGFEVRARYDWGQIAGINVSTPLAYGRTRGTDLTTGLPVNAVDPARLTLGWLLETADWDLRLDLSHHAAKTESELDSPYLPKPVNPPRLRQLLVPAATSVDLAVQWRITHSTRLNLALVNLTNKKYWNWSDVQGVAANSSIKDAYTQPGRHLNLSVVVDF